MNTTRALTKLVKFLITESSTLAVQELFYDLFSSF